jgi:hypothetical protein
MLDCRYLGLIPFEIEKISAAQSGEILAILVPAEPFRLDDNLLLCPAQETYDRDEA